MANGLWWEAVEFNGKLAWRIHDRGVCWVSEEPPSGIPKAARDERVREVKKALKKAPRYGA